MWKEHCLSRRENELSPICRIPSSGVLRSMEQVLSTSLWHVTGQLSRADPAAWSGDTQHTPRALHSRRPHTDSEATNTAIRSHELSLESVEERPGFRTIPRRHQYSIRPTGETWLNERNTNTSLLFKTPHFKSFSNTHFEGPYKSAFI